MRRTARLREVMREPGIIVMPGAYEALSARLIEKFGFDERQRRIGLPGVRALERRFSTTTNYGGSETL